MPAEPSPSPVSVTVTVTVARWLESALLAAGGLLLCVPLALTLFLHFRPDLWPGVDVLRNRTLVGVGHPPPAVFSWPALLHARYQDALEQAFDEDFTGREPLIRGTNEVWVRLFGASGMGGAEPLVLGVNRTLFQDRFLREYCLDRHPVEDLDGLTRDLARLQAGCRARGMAFAVLLTPSKPATYPELMPRAWVRAYDPRPRAVEGFRRALAANGVALVDGGELTVRAKPSAPAPLFPLGGAHWNSQAAYLSANALLAELQRQGAAVSPMELAEFRVTDDPRGTDFDLMGMMNLVWPWRYPVVELRPRDRAWPERARQNLVIVGSSFAFEPAVLLSRSGMFSEIDQFFYYRKHKRAYFDGQIVQFRGPVTALAPAREVFAADALVVEFNEGIFEAVNLTREFVTDALRYLDTAAPPPAGAARPPFEGEGFQPYAWGEDLSFHAGAPGEVGPGTVSGFSQVTPGGTWTEGSPALVRLRPGTPPPPGDDLLLEAEVGAFVDPARGLSQDAEVMVNGIRIGRWEFPTAAVSRRQLLVPRRLLDQPRFTLSFQVSHPTSPADLGQSGDRRQLGLCFSTLRLRPAPALPYGWGRWLWFGTDPGPPPAGDAVDPAALTGFSTPEPTGTWTIGTTATLNLRVPPLPAGGGDLTLEAEVQPFNDPRPGGTAQRVTVYVNEEPAGEWTFPETSVQRRELRVPRGRLDGGEGAVRLRFEIAHPLSPTESGQGNDPRRLGLFFRAMRLVVGPGA